MLLVEWSQFIHLIAPRAKLSTHSKSNLTIKVPMKVCTASIWNNEKLHFKCSLPKFSNPVMKELEILMKLRKIN